MKEKLIAIVGPTAVGKTKTSIELAKALNGEIISGDSMQVYKHMDIGTAKVKDEEMEGIPHHLIDIKEPTEPFSVAEFQKRATELITDINQRGKIPIIVGGTGLYVQSVTHQYNFSDASSNVEFRNKLEQQVAENGIEPLYQKLVSIDPKSAENIHPNNHRRVIRALEVYHETGLTMSEYQAKQQKESPYDLFMVGLTMDRDKLYERINMRVDMMVEEGLIEEVKGLHEKGVRDCQSVQAIGYKEIYDFIEGNVSLEGAIENLKQNSRRYAKRQLTWFRNKMDISWYDMTNNREKVILEILEDAAGKFIIKRECNTIDE
ncbi:tRNA (adenosine(37)-N6)-dimethylallyltransferase MiaA [Lottiidibacillus patelloidae]|uniref:tRNA dimethylallyltransferase n=1 Tax=Lottiidibacillus patelloidae TaxID=2670334 RepID=A0A263BZT4_9BACI|nr:tRNA (adenosine(37)-N6)-dimethylallyltransferase MiaA [Lottiidibacillus patelloidae]OZM58656.1 tRNA (adenosine(37)-N6)-dimethylallyltransferase MiaA [Lottiidibacillus patelloidae]